MPSERHKLRPSVPAAQYLRAAAEQPYSTDTQREVIREFATRRGYKIVQTYADEGKSGLQLERREARRKLIEAVENGTPPFKAVFVYYVSRFGATLAIRERRRNIERQ